MRRRLGVLAVVTILMGCVYEAEAQTGPYIQTDLGAAVAPPLTVHGSGNDWGTKCDLIINPLGVEVGSECAAAPPRSSWTNEFGGGIRAGFALGYGWGAVRLEGEYFRRVTAYNDHSDLNIFDEVSLDKREQEIELAVGNVDDLQSNGLFVNVY